MTSQRRRRPCGRRACAGGSPAALPPLCACATCTKRQRLAPLPNRALPRTAEARGAPSTRAVLPSRRLSRGGIRAVQCPRCRRKVSGRPWSTGWAARAASQGRRASTTGGRRSSGSSATTVVPRLGETIGGFGGSGWRSITGWKSRDHPAGDQRRRLPAGGHRVRLQYRRAKPDSSLLIPESTAVDSGHEILDIQPNGRDPLALHGPKALICGCPRARRGRLYFMQRAPSCIVDYRIGTDACSFGIASRGHWHRPSRLD